MRKMQDIREKKRDWIHSRTLLLLNLTHENTRIHTVITQDINPASNPSHIFTIIHFMPSHIYYLAPSTAESTRQERDNSRHSVQAK